MYCVLSQIHIYKQYIQHKVNINISKLKLVITLIYVSETPKKRILTYQFCGISTYIY